MPTSLPPLGEVAIMRGMNCALEFQTGAGALQWVSVLFCYTPYCWILPREVVYLLCTCASESVSKDQAHEAHDTETSRGGSLLAQSAPIPVCPFRVLAAHLSPSYLEPFLSFSHFLCIQKPDVLSVACRLIWLD